MNKKPNKSIQVENPNPKDRKKHQEELLVSLGAKPAKRQKLSLPIHIGMQKKAKERVSKKIENAKNIGTYTKSMVNQFTLQESALAIKPKKKQKNINITPKVKSGVLKVSKKLISKLSK